MGINNNALSLHAERADLARQDLCVHLHNDRYAGVWRFKERQWVKVPSTNKRRPKPRDPGDVITQERPDLRIVDAETWVLARARLTTVRERFTKQRNADGTRKAGGIARTTTGYLLTGILVCARCGSPMTIMAGTSASYYRCSLNRTKGMCEHPSRAAGVQRRPKTRNP